MTCDLLGELNLIPLIFGVSIRINCDISAAFPQRLTVSDRFVIITIIKKCTDYSLSCLLNRVRMSLLVQVISKKITVKFIVRSLLPSSDSGPQGVLGPV